MDELQDTGDFLEVPESEQMDEDDLVLAEVNEDEFDTMEDVEDGDEYVVLSTADLDDEDLDDDSDYDEEDVD